MLQYQKGQESTNALLAKNLLPVIEKMDPKNITKLNEMGWHQSPCLHNGTR